MKRTIIMLLAIVLLFSAFGTALAFADEEENAAFSSFTDLEVKLDGKTYFFSNSLDSIREQGIALPDSVTAGRWVRIENGEQSYEVQIDQVAEETGELCVSGIRLYADNLESAEIANGITLGKTTAREIYELLGASFSGTPGDPFEYSYRAFHDYLRVRFKFSTGENLSFDEVTKAKEKAGSWGNFLENERFGNAVLSMIEITNDIPSAFGMLPGEIAKLQSTASDLDRADLGFDSFLLNGVLYHGHVTVRQLMDNGWKIDIRNADKDYEAIGNSGAINSWSVFMYDGKSLVEVFPYNGATEGNCKLEDCDVLEIRALEEDGARLVIVGGLTDGCDFAAVQRLFDGEFQDNQKSFREEELQAYTRYSYQIEQSSYTFHVVDGKVIELGVMLPRS